MSEKINQENEFLTGFENFAQEQNKERRKLLNEKQNREIVSFVNGQSFMPAAAIAEIKDKFAEANDAMMNALNADELIAQTQILHGIDLTKIYCCKTGQEIGVRSVKQIGLLTQMFKDRQNLLDILKYSIQFSVASHWQMTGPEQMGRLYEIDPVGYFVYAASLAIHQPIPQNAAMRQGAEFADYELDFVKQKVKLNEWLQGQELDLIIKSNEAWRALLGYCNPQRMKVSIAWPFSSLQEIQNEETLRTLAQNLMKIFVRIIKKDGMFASRTNIAIAEFNEARRRNGGYDIFHYQGKYKIPNLISQLDLELKNAGVEIGKYIPVPIEKDMGTGKKNERVPMKQVMVKLEKAGMADALLAQITNPETKLEEKPKTNTNFLSALSKFKK